MRQGNLAESDRGHPVVQVRPAAFSLTASLPSLTLSSQCHYKHLDSSIIPDHPFYLSLIALLSRRFKFRTGEWVKGGRCRASAAGPRCWTECRANTGDDAGVRASWPPRWRAMSLYMCRERQALAKGLRRELLLQERERALYRVA
jgi:hypothetical protein